MKTIGLRTEKQAPFTDEDLEFLSQSSPNLSNPSLNTGNPKRIYHVSLNSRITAKHKRHPVYCYTDEKFGDV